MKKIISNISKTLLIIGVVFATWSCSDDWLRPNPLSQFTPENVFVDEAGFQALLAQAESNMRWHWGGESAFALAEMRFSDVAVTGQTDANSIGFNWDADLLPAVDLAHFNRRIFGWWYEAWHGINTANTVISRIDNWTDGTTEQRNAILGAAYFHRSWRYFNLVNQFGDVPWLDTETSTPRTDFFSYCRWSILERIAEDMEFAFQYLPATAWRGRVNRYGAGVLLMKIHKSLLNWDRALAIGREIVEARPMVTQRNIVPLSMQGPRTTLMHDLFSPEGMTSPANTEGLHFIVSDPTGGLGASSMLIMRDLLPFWQSPFWNVPGLTPAAGMHMNPTVGFNTPNYNLRYGRGIARTRPTHFKLFDIWDMDPTVPIGDVVPSGRHVNDIRSPLHVNVEGQRTGWRFPEDLTYNAPDLRTGTPAQQAWYGRNVVRPAHVLHPITTAVGWQEYIRAWFHWPHYRWYAPSAAAREAMGGDVISETRGNNVAFAPMHDGGPRPWYIYRTAEVHLMMAEIYYWTDNEVAAADQINLVRQRAGALPITAADIDIGMILAERARELSTEELRNSELTRIAFTYAKTQRPSSVFGGRVFAPVSEISGPRGSNINYKGTGVNFFFDWIMKVNNFMRDRVTQAGGGVQTYQMSVHHILWPVPESIILQNTTGHLNQNIGYTGSETNIPPRIVPPRTP